MKKITLRFSLLVIFGLLVGTSIVFAAPISSTYSTASFLDLDLDADTVKDRINWKTTNGTAVNVTDTALTGDIWGDTVGWIRLNPTNGGITNTCSGILSGYAFGQNTGWVNFKPTNGGVTISTATGDFSGYAWSENYGWIHFDPNVPAKHVQTDWHGCPMPPSSGGMLGGIGNITPTVTTACNDSIDNDSDGKTDYPADPGCTSPTDTTEENPVTIFACSDGIDNDSDGRIDYPADPGCTRPNDLFEKDPVQPVEPTAPVTPPSLSVATLDNQPLNGPNPTTNTRPTVVGNGTPGDRITIKDARGNVMCSTSVDSSGIWSCTLSTPLTKGPNYLSVFATGPKGDAVVPLVITLGDLTVTTVDDKPLSDNNITTNTQPPIVGAGVPGDTITINNDTGVTICATTVNSNGTWECTPTVPLQKGENKLTVVSQSDRGAYEVPLVVTLNEQEKLPILPGTINPFGRIDIRDLAAPLRGPLITLAIAGLLSTIPGFIARLGHFFLTFLLYRRRNPWGVVYDSKTKQPLDPAIVTIIDVVTGRQVEQKTTDMEGRYGFYLQPGTYRIEAGKTHYQFPSLTLAGRGAAGTYEHLYFGGDFTIPEGRDRDRVVTMNIPMDPLAEDWNQTEKKRMGVMDYLTKHSPIWNIIAKVLFIAGFIFSAIITYLYPTKFNVVVLGLYLLVLILGLLGVGSISGGSVTHNDKPLVKAMIRVYNARLRTEIAHRITDDDGRYYILVANGEYYVTISETLPDGSSNILHTSEAFEITHGVINKSFKI